VTGSLAHNSLLNASKRRLLKTQKWTCISGGNTSLMYGSATASFNFFEPSFCHSICYECLTDESSFYFSLLNSFLAFAALEYPIVLTLHDIEALLSYFYACYNSCYHAIILLKYAMHFWVV
jgi:hypothetical protein